MGQLLSTQAPAVLYVARVNGTDICRIGVSRELDVRMKVLQKHCHREISLCWSLEIHPWDKPETVFAAFRARVAEVGTLLQGDWYRLDVNSAGHAILLTELEFK